MGSIVPIIGAPGKLDFTLIQGDKEVEDGDELVTAGLQRRGARLPPPAGDPDRRGQRGDPGRAGAATEVTRRALRRPRRPRRGHRPDRGRLVIVTPRIFLRLALLIFLAVLVQLGFFSQVPLLGSVANLVPVVVVALGLLGGAVTGAVVRLRRRPAARRDDRRHARRSPRCRSWRPATWRAAGARATTSSARWCRRCSRARSAPSPRPPTAAPAHARRRRPGQRAGAARDRRPGAPRRPARGARSSRSSAASSGPPWSMTRAPAARASRRAC